MKSDIRKKTTTIKEIDSAKNKNFAIQIIRVLAMLFIVICHLCNESKNSMISSLGQFFNIGVFIFIFISGFLYGNKNIDNNSKWLFNRLKRIMIPIYIFILFFIFLTSFITEIFHYKFLFIYLFDLQYFLGSVKNAGHLWFCSVIVICYLLLPLMNKYKEKLISNFYPFSILIITISCLVGLVSKSYGLLGFYLLTFYIGYFFKNSINIVKVKYFIPISLIIVGLIFRIIGKYLFDNTLLYETTITALTHIMMTIGIFIFIYKLFNKFKASSITQKIINYFDELSYYIYIVHYMFIVGPISVMNITNNFVINLAIFIILTIMSAYVLKICTDIFCNIKLKKINLISLLQFLEIFTIVIYKFLLAYNYRNNWVLYFLIIIAGILFLIIFAFKMKEIRKKDFIIFGLLMLLALITVYILKSVNFIFPLFIALSFYNNDPKKIAKMYFCSLLFGFILTLMLNSINILPDHNVSRMVNGKMFTRYGLGFINTAFVMLYYIFICLSYYYGYGFSKTFALMSSFFGLILFYLCNSRTGLFTLIIFELLLFLNRKFKIIEKTLKFLVPNLFSIFLLLMLLLTICYKFFDISYFNQIFSGRLDFNLWFYEHGYFWSLFGVQTSLNIPLDNYYFYPLIKLGIVGCILFLIIDFKSLYNLRHINSLMIVQFIVLLYGLGDSNVIVSSINFMLSIQAMVLINSKNKYLLKGDVDETKRFN